MAYPTGSGSEIISRTTIHAQSNTTTTFRWDGTNATAGTSSYVVPANHIITVISIIITDQGNAAELIDLYVVDGSNNIFLLANQPIAAYGTFVWNDKFVIKGGDKLIAVCGSTANVDFLCTYIDQNWVD